MCFGISVWLSWSGIRVAGCSGSSVVKALCYKSEGRWFDPSWCQWIFHRHKILPIAVLPWSRLSLQQKWVSGIFSRGKGGRCVRLTTYHHLVPLSWNLRGILWPLRACNGTNFTVGGECNYGYYWQWWDLALRTFRKCEIIVFKSNGRREVTEHLSVCDPKFCC